MADDRGPPPAPRDRSPGSLLLTLSAVSARLAVAADADVARLFVEEATYLLGADQVQLALVDADPGWWVLRQAGGSAAGRVGERHPRTDGLLGQVIGSGEPIVVADFAAHPLAAEPAAATLGSLVAVPLRLEDQVLGAVLAARSPGAPALTPADAAAFTALSNLAAARLGATPAAVQLRARAQELAPLNPLWRPPPEQAGDFVTICHAVNGRDRPLLDVDAAACRILGYPRELLLQRAIRDLIPLPPGAENVDTLGSVRDQMVRGVPVTYDTIIRRRDGSLLPVRMTIQRVDLPEGFVYRGTFLDLSREREAQVQALQMEKQRLLQEIGANLAHELNTPLSVVLGNIEMVLDDYADPDLHDLLRPVQAAAQRIAASVRGLQGFAKLTVPGGWTAVDLSQLVSQGMEQNRRLWDTEPRSQGRVVELRLETPPVAPVRGNPLELQTALQELVSNAVQALPEGGTITVQTGQDADGVFLSVADNGVGMNDEVRNRCVEPFFTTRRPLGSGLGLNRVYHIVLLHHGQLRIESTEGQGSRLTIVLPLTLPPDAV